MEKLEKSLKTHLFICCRQKDNKACCAEKGSEAWVKQLKDWVKTEGLKGQVSVAKSSCLGECENGVTAVFYPQNRWLYKLREEDLPQIRELIKEFADV